MASSRPNIVINNNQVNAKSQNNRRTTGPRKGGAERKPHVSQKSQKNIVNNTVIQKTIYIGSGASSQHKAGPPKAANKGKDLHGSRNPASNRNSTGPIKKSTPCSDFGHNSRGQTRNARPASRGNRAFNDSKAVRNPTPRSNAGPRQRQTGKVKR